MIHMRKWLATNKTSWWDPIWNTMSSKSPLVQRWPGNKWGWWRMEVLHTRRSEEPDFFTVAKQKLIWNFIALCKYIMRLNIRKEKIFWRWSTALAQEQMGISCPWMCFDWKLKGSFLASWAIDAGLPTQVWRHRRGCTTESEQLMKGIVWCGLGLAGDWAQRHRGSLPALCSFVLIFLKGIWRFRMVMSHSWERIRLWEEKEISNVLARQMYVITLFPIRRKWTII